LGTGSRNADARSSPEFGAGSRNADARQGFETELPSFPH